MPSLTESWILLFIWEKKIKVLFTLIAAFQSIESCVYLGVWVAKHARACLRVCVCVCAQLYRVRICVTQDIVAFVFKECEVFASFVRCY